MKIDLKEIPTKELLKEIEYRKKNAIPEIVKNLNENIKMLSELGVKIYDSCDNDYRIDKIDVNKDGEVNFHTVERWDD